MAAGVSTWWATPADPERHFTDADLTWSDRYHRRVRRAGGLGLLAKVLLLAFAALVLGRSGDRSGADQRWFDETSWLSAAVSWRVVVAAVASVLALRLPAVVVDGWFEYRFRHGKDDHRPVPVIWFALTTIGLAVGSLVLLAVAAGLGYRLVVATDAWPLVFVAVVILATVLFAIGERWGRQIVGRGEEPISDDDLASALARLAATMDLSGLRFATSAPNRPDLGPAGDVPNAFSVGVGANRRVVMTEALTEEPAEVRDFVVAHELTHVARRHVLTQTAVAVAVAASIIVALWLLLATGHPWSWFGFEPADPLGLPVTVLVGLFVLGLLGPVTGWISRAQERVADAGAVAVVGPLTAAQASRLYVATTADLRPPWWVRLYSVHPAPAERLEFLARQRRSATEHTAEQSAKRSGDRTAKGAAESATAAKTAPAETR